MVRDGRLYHIFVVAPKGMAEEEGDLLSLEVRQFRADPVQLRLSSGGIDLLHCAIRVPSHMPAETPKPVTWFQQSCKKGHFALSTHQERFFSATLKPTPRQGLRIG